MNTPMSDEKAPLLRVVSPDATPEEIAALVAVVASLGGAEPPPARRPDWNRPARLVRTTHRHGPDAWRASSLPR